MLSLFCYMSMLTKEDLIAIAEIMDSKFKGILISAFVFPMVNSLITKKELRD